MTQGGDLDIVKQALVDRIQSVCEQLLPGGRVEGGQWVANNPVTGDHDHTPALKVRLRGGDAIGAWKCWRCGDKGDALGLVAYCLRTDTKGALAWARDFLGIKPMSRHERETMRQAAAAVAKKRDHDAERARRWKLQQADRLFFAAGPQSADIGPAAVPAGTFKLGAASPAEAHARAYFAARAMPLERIARLNTLSFRFSPATEYWRGATWKNEGGRRWKAARGPLYPAVHAAMRNVMGLVTACHVTFLDPVRPAKAPQKPAKMMFGEALGAVIEIATGPSGIPFWMSDRDGLEPCPLIIGEGIETVGPFAVEIPEARAWAGGSLSGVAGAAAAIARLDCVTWILFARDNNAGNPQAQRQFSAALDALEATGKRVEVAASHVGDDFNDLATGEE